MIQAISFSLERSSFGYPGLTFDNIDLNVIFVIFSGVFRSAMTIIFKVCLITRRSIVRSSRFIFAVIRWFFLFSRSCRMLSPARCSSFLLFLELFDMSGTTMILSQCFETTFSVQVYSSGRSTYIVKVIEFTEIILSMYQ